MNLNAITIAPFVQGAIKVDSHFDESGVLHTAPQMGVFARHHDREATLAQGRPVLARHPIERTLMEKVDANKAAGKLVQIPIRSFFNKTDNAIGIRYQAFNSNGVPVCAGDGKNAQRQVLAGDGTQTISEVECPGCDSCPFALSGEASCARQVRMTVQIEGQEDALSTFEIRSSSINSFRTLKAQLALVERRFSGLRHVPLRLTLWQASNQLSQYEPFDLLRLEIDASSEAAAMSRAKQARDAVAASGINDETDEVYSQNQRAAMPAWEDDITLVSDFYEVTERPRRRDSSKIPLTTPDGSTKAKGAANKLIEEAVRRSQAAAQATEPSLDAR
jgi:hypothetical protein